MKYPVSVCDTCPQSETCDYPCRDRARNLSQFRTFESKMKRRIAKGIARSTGVPWKSDVVRTASNHVSEKIIAFMRGRGK